MMSRAIESPFKNRPLRNMCVPTFWFDVLFKKMFIQLSLKSEQDASLSSEGKRALSARLKKMSSLAFPFTLNTKIRSYLINIYL